MSCQFQEDRGGGTHGARHSELLIPRPRCPESIEILNQMLFLARLQQHGLKQARRIRFYVIPASSYWYRYDANRRFL